MLLVNLMDFDVLISVEPAACFFTDLHGSGKWVPPTSLLPLHGYVSNET